LAGTGLLLDGFDLHDFVLELGQKPVDDLVFLDRERVQVDLFHALDLSGLDKTTELGDGLPFLLVGFRATAAGSSSSSAVTSSSSSVSSAASSSSDAATSDQPFGMTLETLTSDLATQAGVSGVKKGAIVTDVEFVQFHPTSFVTASVTSVQRPLISEALGDERSVGPPTFNSWIGPMAIILVLLTGLGPSLAWRRATGANISEKC